MNTTLVTRWLALSLTSLCACTQLKTHKVASVNEIPSTNGALPYVLARRSFAITATYVMKGCSTHLDANDEPSLKLDIDTTVMVASSIEPDPDEQYYVDTEALRSWIKETNVSVDSYANQTLKTFNATITDQSAPMVTAVIGTALKIAAVALVANTSQELCDDQTLLILRQVAELKKKAADLAAAKGPDATIASYQSEAANLVSQSLTSKILFSWSPNLADLLPGADGIDTATLKLEPDLAIARWLNADGRQWLTRHPATDQRIVLSLRLPNWAHPTSAQASPPVSDGFVVRQAPMAQLAICKEGCPQLANDITDVKQLLSASSVPVPQFGKKLTMPLHNGLFQSDVLDVTVAEDGALTKLGLHNTPTSTGAVTGIGAGADSLKSTLADRQKALDAERDAALNKVLNDNKRVADCLEAQKKIRDNGGTPSGTCK